MRDRLSKELAALQSKHELLFAKVVAMVPGPLKEQRTVELAHLYQQMKRLKARIAGHGHRKNRKT